MLKPFCWSDFSRETTFLTTESVGWNLSGTKKLGSKVADGNKSLLSHSIRHTNQWKNYLTLAVMINSPGPGAKSQEQGFMLWVLGPTCPAGLIVKHTLIVNDSSKIYDTKRLCYFLSSNGLSQQPIKTVCLQSPKQSKDSPYTSKFF